MSVYIAFRIDYTNREILGVFKHREEAERVLADAKAEYAGYSYEIQEHEINQRQCQSREVNDAKFDAEAWRAYTAQPPPPVSPLIKRSALALSPDRTVIT